MSATARPRAPIDHRAPTEGAAPYDPWLDLVHNWPEVRVVTSALPGDLLGVLRYPVIVLRAGTGPGQRRSTLTHEIVHLERGVLACEQPGSRAGVREEVRVEAEAARRLMPVGDLVRALRTLGSCPSPGSLAAALHVDTQLVLARLASLNPAEHHLIHLAGADDFAAS